MTLQFSKALSFHRVSFFTKIWQSNPDDISFNWFIRFFFFFFSFFCALNVLKQIFNIRRVPISRDKNILFDWIVCWNVLRFYLYLFFFIPLFNNTIFLSRHEQECLIGYVSRDTSSPIIGQRKWLCRAYLNEIYGPGRKQ